MESAQAIKQERARERAVAAMKQVLETVHVDRELVVRSFNTQLTVLKLPQRPVIFYPNLRAASERVASGSEDDAWRAPWDIWNNTAGDPTWAATDAACNIGHEIFWGAARAAWVAAGLAGPAWAAWSTGGDASYAFKGAAAAVAMGAQWPDSRCVMAWQASLEMVRGGIFFLWVMPDAVHVVLATIRTRPPRLAEVFRRFAPTVSRLHCENGPAIEYEDGSGLYFWKGIQVPDHVIFRPDLLRVDMILREANAEVRRAMIERYGQDRFVLDAHAEILDKWKDNELLSIDLRDDPDRRLVALKLRCPSTAAVYIIRVPPDQRTVQGALAWSFGLDRPEDYVLQQES